MNNRWKTGRLEAFSDGVFAIAITLLVLEMDMPDSGFEHLWAGIASQWPSYLAYATSFLTIGVTWLHHHLIFRRMAWLDSMVMRLNMLVLMLVAFLPFPTMLMARALDKTNDAERVAVVFYGIVLLAIALTMVAIWSQAARRDLLEPTVTGPEVRAVTRLTRPVVLPLDPHEPRATASVPLIPGRPGLRRDTGTDPAQHVRVAGAGMVRDLP